MRRLLIGLGLGAAASLVALVAGAAPVVSGFLDSVELNTYVGDCA